MFRGNENFDDDDFCIIENSSPPISPTHPGPRDIPLKELWKKNLATPVSVQIKNEEKNIEPNVPSLHIEIETEISERKSTEPSPNTVEETKETSTKIMSQDKDALMSTAPSEESPIHKIPTPIHHLEASPETALQPVAVPTISITVEDNSSSLNTAQPTVEPMKEILISIVEDHKSILNEVTAQPNLEEKNSQVLQTSSAPINNCVNSTLSNKPQPVKLTTSEKLKRLLCCICCCDEKEKPAPKKLI